jgi:hypothetical protein
MPERKDFLPLTGRHVKMKVFAEYFCLANGSCHTMNLNSIKMLHQKTGALHSYSMWDCNALFMLSKNTFLSQPPTNNIKRFSCLTGQEYGTAMG